MLSVISDNKDKSTAEGTVKVIETWILAALRNRVFFTYDELNLAVREKLTEYNERPFQKKKGSRQSVFEEEEKEFLMPLPATPYETAVWSTATIQPDYLISVEESKYSVPYEFIGKKVDIRSTEKVIEVFYHNNRVASHIRKDNWPDPFYIPEHMPEKHRIYMQYNSEYFLKWAAENGSSTLTVVKGFLYSHKVEQQGYKTCASLMRLADRYTPQSLEQACERALSFTSSPSLKNISIILKNKLEKSKGEKVNYSNGSQYGITRGSAYYGGERK